MRIGICFLLLSISVLAQRPNVAYQRTVEDINAFLDRAKSVQFVNRDDDVFNLRKIKSNPKGKVEFVDAATNEDSNADYKIFNLLDVKEFVAQGNEIKVLDEDDKVLGAFINIEVQDRYAFLKNFKALHLICSMYAKEDPIADGR